MMQPKVIEFQREQELFRAELVNLVEQRHALVKLAESIDWNAAAERFGALYATGGGPSRCSHSPDGWAALFEARVQPLR